MTGYHRMYWALRKQGLSDSEAREKVREHFGTKNKRKRGKKR